MSAAGCPRVGLEAGDVLKGPELRFLHAAILAASMSVFTEVTRRSHGCDTAAPAPRPDAWVLLTRQKGSGPDQKDFLCALRSLSEGSAVLCMGRGGH